MKVFDTATIRNLAVVGHGGSGKTQLIAATAFVTGVTPRLGRVDDGTTVTDVDDEAIARKHTLSAGLAHVVWEDTKINLIDTPGLAAFLAEARAALRVVDAALVVVDAVSGAEVQTEKLWNEAAGFGLPRLVVVNRLDRDRASFERAIASMQSHCARAVVPIQLPIGEGRDFEGIIDLVRMVAVRFAKDGSGAQTEAPLPDSQADAARLAREALLELVAESDERLMETFFATGTLTPEQLHSGLVAATAEGRIFPALCAAGLSVMGIQPLLRAVRVLTPAPSARPFPTTEPADGLRADATSPAAAVVWKTLADPFAGRLSLLRVLSGSLTTDATIANRTRGHAERLGHLCVLEGKTQLPVTALKAGDIGAVPKLKDTHTGDVLAEPAAKIDVTPLNVPEAVIAYALEPKSRADEDKLGVAMQRLTEEDPSLRFTRDAQTHELLLAGQGQLHIEVAVAKLRRRFGVEVTLTLPHVPYRETITVPTEAHGRHKKQTGGHGQFGDCKIRVEPLPRGSDFQFVDDVFGGAIPRQFIPAVEKGIQEGRAKGVLAGYPMVDFKATVFDGSFHPVDSNELSFKMAGLLAFKDAMTRSRPTLLEPLMQVEVYAPSDFAGDLMGDLNGRRGKIAGMDTRGAMTVIRALVPMAEMLTYEQHLTSATGGRGSYHMEYSHYEEVPHQAQAKIIAAARAERGHEQTEES